MLILDLNINFIGRQDKEWTQNCFLGVKNPYKISLSDDSPLKSQSFTFESFPLIRPSGIPTCLFLSKI